MTSQLRRCTVIISLISFPGCALFEDEHMQRLSFGNRHHDVVRIVEGKLQQGKHVSTYQLWTLGKAYCELRHYDKLIATADRMDASISAGDKSFSGIGDMTFQPAVLRIKAHLYLGNYDRAIAEGLELRTRLREGNEQRHYFGARAMISALGALGVASAFQGRLGESDGYARELKRLTIPFTGHVQTKPEKQFNLARIHIARKDFAAALAEVRAPGAKHRGLATGWYDSTFQDVAGEFILAKCLYETGRMDEACEKYDGLLEHPRITQVAGICWIILYDRARIARRRGRLSRAESLLSRATEMIEKQRAAISSESGRIGFVGDKQGVYQELVSLLVARDKDSDAFECAERSKARALVDLLAHQERISARGGDSGRGDRLVGQLAQIEYDLQILPDPQDREGRERTRGVLIGLKDELASEAPELASLLTVTNTPTKEIQKLLAPNEALLEYYYSDKELFVFLLTPEGIVARTLGRTGLEEDIRAFRQAVADPRSADYLRHSQALYRRLLRPASSHLAGKRLIIVPHGLLHYIPFNAMHSGQAYLVDQFSVRVLPSASVMKFLRVHNAAKGRLLALGNPDLGNPKLDLPSAQEEAVAVAKTAVSAEVRLRKDATETFVKRQGRRFGTLHFATHGTFDQRKPLDSALLLARDAENDGLLRVAELYSLRLNADLVTLSGCQTALGKVASGDDVVGFTRGLLYAGTNSIVSSLWNVPDKATRDLMVAFYRNRVTMGKPEALRQAQLHVKKQRPHPYYWGAFQVTGKGR